MLTESEILSQHRGQLRIAFEACERLKMNAVEPRPRGHDYRQLKDATAKLEGTCRQMFHWRGDEAEWLRLGAIYARAAKTAHRLFLAESWALFGSLAELFQAGMRRVDDLAERPTGRSIDKMIAPGDISPWFEAPRLKLQ